MSAGILDGRVAVVFGATGWIGRAICHELVRSGASVLVVGRDADRLDGLQRELAGGERVAAALADVTSQLEVDDVRAAAVARFGHVDLLVASAGVITGSSFADGVPADWAEMIDVNLRGLLHVAQSFSDPLLEVADRGGRADLVLIGAVGTDVRAPRFAVFNALSAAVKQLARALRLEYAPRGVRVHVLEPSYAVGHPGEPAAGPATRETGDAPNPHSTSVSAAVKPDAIAAVVALAAALPRAANLAEALLLPSETP